MSFTDIFRVIQGVKDALRGVPHFRWGIVTATDPLTVRLDADEDPLDGVPSTLVSGLQVGDRVHVLVQNRRAVIIGKAKGQPLPEHSTTVPFLSPFYTYSSAQESGVLFERYGNLIQVQGVAGVSNSSNINSSTPMAYAPDWAIPSTATGWSIQQGSGDAVWLVSVQANGMVRGERYRPSSTSSNIWLPFSFSYSITNW